MHILPAALMSWPGLTWPSMDGAHTLSLCAKGRHDKDAA
jgi:hypothetical protein